MGLLLFFYTFLLYAGVYLQYHDHDHYYHDLLPAFAVAAAVRPDACSSFRLLLRPPLRRSFVQCVPAQTGPIWLASSRLADRGAASFAARSVATSCSEVAPHGPLDDTPVVRVRGASPSLSSLSRRRLAPPFFSKMGGLCTHEDDVAQEYSLF